MQRLLGNSNIICSQVTLSNSKVNSSRNTCMDRIYAALDRDPRHITEKEVKQGKPNSRAIP